MLKKYDLTINGKQFEVAINEVGYTTAKVTVNGNPYEIEMTHEEQKDMIPKLVRSNSPSQLRKSDVVTAPMPGLILEILVNQGDSVKAGQLLLKMEAMKMENEIRSPVDGIVREIKIKASQDVLEGDVLMLFQS